MNIFTAVTILVLGLVVLWKSADILVDGAVRLANYFAVSPFVIGLTIIAVGTSAPEGAASIAAALKGTADIAVGNVYGSNIANLALVGGICAIIRPMVVEKKILCRQLPTMLLVALLLWPFVYNGVISRLEGFFLLVIFVVFIWLTVRFACSENERTNPVQTDKSVNTVRNIFFVVIGLVGLAIGAEMTVRGAVYIGHSVGMSDAVIGLTIIAFGTSLPELVTSIVAVFKHQHGVSIGNIVGSNIFNTLLVVGTASGVRPLSGITARLAGGLDYWMMVAASAGFILLILLGRGTIRRLYGAVLVCGYVGYIIYLFLY